MQKTEQTSCRKPAGKERSPFPSSTSNKKLTREGIPHPTTSLRRTPRGEEGAKGTPGQPALSEAEGGQSLPRPQSRWLQCPATARTPQAEGQIIHERIRRFPPHHAIPLVRLQRRRGRRLLLQHLPQLA